MTIETQSTVWAATEEEKEETRLIVFSSLIVLLGTRGNGKSTPLGQERSQGQKTTDIYYTNGISTTIFIRVHLFFLSPTNNLVSLEKSTSGIAIAR